MLCELSRDTSRDGLLNSAPVKTPKDNKGSCSLHGSRFSSCGLCGSVHEGAGSEECPYYLIAPRTGPGVVQVAELQGSVLVIW